MVVTYTEEVMKNKKGSIHHPHVFVAKIHRLLLATFFKKLFNLLHSVPKNIPKSKAHVFLQTHPYLIEARNIKVIRHCNLIKGMKVGEFSCFFHLTDILTANYENIILVVLPVSLKLLLIFEDPQVLECLFESGFVVGVIIVVLCEQDKVLWTQILVYKR